MKKFFCCLCAAAVALSAHAQFSWIGSLFQRDSELTVSAETIQQLKSYQPGDSYEPVRKFDELVKSAVRDKSLSKPIEDALIQLLEPESTLEAKRYGCQQIAILGSEAALPTLSRLLIQPETTALACQALTTYPAGKADEVVRDSLQNCSGATRMQLILLAGARGSPKVLKSLETLAKSNDRAEAEAAILAIGNNQASSAWTVLEGMKLSPPASVQMTVTKAQLRQAQRLGYSKITRRFYETLLADLKMPVYVQRSALEALLAGEPNRAQQRIQQVLEGSNPGLKPAAIAGISRLENPETSSTFAKYMNRLTGDEQVCLIEALAARGDPAARAAILTQFASQNVEVRQAAFRAMGNLGGPQDVPEFVRALGQSSGAEARAIETALVELRSTPEVNRAITSQLTATSGKTRAQLIGVVMKREGSEATALFFHEALDSDPQVAAAAWQALRKTARPEDAAQLLSNLNRPLFPQVRGEAEAACSAALTSINDPGRRSLLLNEAYASAMTPDAKVSLLGLFPTAGDSRALATVRTALAQNDSRVRSAAMATIAEWPNPAVWDELFGLYSQPGDENLRSAALRGLTRLAAEMNAKPDALLVPRYRDLLARARNDADRKAILGAMGGAAQLEAFDLTVPLLTAPGVRAEAEVAARRIAENLKKQNPQAAEAALKKLPGKS